MDDWSDDLEEYSLDEQGTSSGDWEDTFGDENVHDGYSEMDLSEEGDGDADAFLAAAESAVSEGLEYDARTGKLVGMATPMPEQPRDAARDADNEAFRADNKKRHEEGYGRASILALKEGQLSHASPTVRKAVLDLRAGTLDGSAAGKDQMDLDYAREELDKALGGQLDALDIRVKPHEMPSKVHRIKESLYGDYQINTSQKIPEGGYDHKYVMRPSSQTVNLALGFATKTEDYLQRGAGGSLPSNNLSADTEGLSVADSNRRFNKQKKDDEEMEKAMAIIHNMAGLYVPEATKANEGLYATRIAAVENALIKRALDGQVYEDSEAAVPYPNEVGVMRKGDAGVPGLKPTKSYGGTSPFNRLEWGMNKDKFEEGSKAFFAHMPNLRGSLFDYDKTQDDPKKHQKDQLAGVVEDYSFAIRVLREQMPTVQDENWGNQSRHAGQGTLNGSDDEINTWEEANELGLDLSGEDATSLRMTALEASQMGSSQVGLTGHGSLESRTKGLTGFAKMDASVGFIRTRAGKLSATGKIDERGVSSTDAGFIVDGDDEHWEHGTRGKGGNEGRAGMHGEPGESEYSIYSGARNSGLSKEESYEMAKQGFSQAELEADRTDPFPTHGTDQEQYRWRTRNGQSPEQGSAAWLRQRKGKVTASQMVLMQEKRGVEKLANEMAAGRLDPDGSKGYHDKFYGNSYTRDGNRFEALVRDKFLKTVGKEFDAEEAFFGTHSENSRIGASPDGMLFNKKSGKSEGLLELKYLTPGAMEEAHKKYNNQMQMQMMVTGETVTHFFALDKYTDDYVHEIVHADPELQAELLAESQEVLNLTKGIKTLGDVQDMRNKIKSKKPKGAKGAVAGQEAKFVQSNKGGDAPATPFRPDGPQVSNNEDLYNQAMDIRRRSHKPEQAGDMMTNMFKIRREQQAAAGRDALAHSSAGPEVADTRMGAEEAEELAHAMNDAAESTDEAAQATKTFGDSVGEASGALAILSNAMMDAAKIVLEGNKSGMDTVRFAAKTGMDADRARGLNFALQDAGLSESGADSVMQSAGTLQDTFNNEATGAKKLTKILHAQGTSNLDAVRGLDMPSFERMREMNPQEWIATIQKMMEGKSPQEKAAIGKIFGTEDLAASNASGATLGGASSTFAEGEARAVNAGVVNANQVLQTAKEGAAQIAGDNVQTAKAVGATATAMAETGKYASTNNAVFQATVGAAGVGAITGSFLFDQATPGQKEAGQSAFDSAMDFFGGNRERDNYMPDGKIDNGYIPKTAEEARRILNSNVNVDIHVDEDSIRSRVDDNGILSIDQEARIAP